MTRRYPKTYTAARIREALRIMDGGGGEAALARHFGIRRQDAARLYDAARYWRKQWGQAPDIGKEGAA